MAAIGTPRALASSSTRLSDSGPRDVKMSSEACASQAVVCPWSTHPVKRMSHCERSAWASMVGAIGSVADDDERPVEARAFDDVDQR